MSIKYIEYSLNKEYLKQIEKLTSVNLIIVGRDPYPTNPTSIPFMKLKWEELDTRSSGYNIINSLYGFQNAKNEFNSPENFAFFILTKGIVFLNCSYHYLKGESFSLKKHSKFCELALQSNASILDKSIEVLLCGDAKYMKHFIQKNLIKKTILAPHPSLQSRNRMIQKKDWDKYWAFNSLNNSN